MIARWVAGLSLVILLGVGDRAEADGPASPPALPSGFRPHLQNVEGGAGAQVDWGNGFLIATGTGQAHGTTDQDRFMAKRAATLVAARNALAVSLGLQIDDKGRFRDIQNGEVRLRGVLKGHQMISEEWRPNAKPPECIVKLRVPIWGVKGMASLVYESQRGQALRGGRRRLALTSTRRDVSNEVLVIDARGTGVAPCLFPVVAETGGGVIYDVGTVSHRRGRDSPTLRYVETVWTLEQLQARLEAEEDGIEFAATDPPSIGWGVGLGAGFSLSRVGWMDLFVKPEIQDAGEIGKTTSQPASQPTSKPTKKPRRRRRRVVKAVKTAGQNKTEIVLTQEDADKLRKSATGASLLRNGQVLVVVDSVAAGIQGRGKDGLDVRTLALFRKQ